MVWRAENSYKKKNFAFLGCDENCMNESELLSESNAHEIKEYCWLVKCSLPVLDFRKVLILMAFPHFSWRKKKEIHNV